ncbi:MAG: hypothetical protein A2Y33_01255 [Spirochaetes bacterium GWF1_51_8]|nr:MAG: hypothetical protein A2Y33_01255 [Spirochaetes bacterium GWF1_51_8]
MKRNLLIFLLFAAAAVFSSCGRENSINEKAVLFEVAKGDSLSSVVDKLTDTGVIDNPNRFKIVAKLMGKDKKIQTGVYQILPGENFADIIEKMTSGKTHSIKITFPEGYNIFEMGTALSNLGICGYDEFMAEVKNPKYTERYGIPAGQSLEGYLFPDTYFVPYKTDVKKVVEMMLNRFDTVVTPDMKQKIKDRGMTLHQVLTMASIIQKETGVEYEMPIVSGVYYNRLKADWMLQADPTIIYGLLIENKYDGNIKKTHLTAENTSPYNTYALYGLPPGPISSVGKQAILAAIFPAQVDYFFFVASGKGDGTHVFSRNVEEHNQAVQLYKQNMKNLKNAQGQ